MENIDELVRIFQNVGLAEKKAKETANNKKIGPIFHTAIVEAGLQEGCDKTTGALLYFLAGKIPKDSKHIGYIAKKIASKDLASNDQVQAAVKYAADNDTIDEAKFNEECGVGVVVTPEEIQAAVKSLLDSKKDELIEKRYTFVGPLLANLRQQLKWANALMLKEELEKGVVAIIGPKDDRDDPKKKKAKAKKENKKQAPVQKKQATGNTSKACQLNLDFIFEGELAKLHKPGGNKQIKESLMEEHLKATGKKVYTRFPPEPNGFLHIGHAKAINVNFGYAQAHNGVTYLRYDDTNPEAEEEKYFTSILETVKWLGFKPWKITYSSDYFDKLYELAVDLTKRGLAYVCHCTGEEIKKQRGGEDKGPRYDCPHRDRPIEENLREFQNMKDGKYKEGEATLRMKMDMQNPNPQFWDLVAYRVMYTKHFRTGDKWCIYPTYDFTHCICDSLENITHSLCTTEFRMSRDSYYWLLDALEIYKPVQWEYGRLSITNTILSKRKLNKLVTEKIVNDWDDPRLFTLPALRRRGFTPEAINAFVRDVGVTTANTIINVSRLENYVRDHLNDIAPRIMTIMDPLKVVITNLADDYVKEITVPNKPRDESMGSHIVPFTKTIYIDRSDFREQDDPNYYRLAPNKTVGLLYVERPITCTEVIKDGEGNIVEIRAKYEDENARRPKTYIQWVAESKKHNSPVEIEVREYSNLFIHENPMDSSVVPNGWLSDINPNSLTVIPKAYAEIGINNCKVEDKFQFVRVGYFCVDSDSKLDGADKKIVVNRTVTLKEDSNKN
ncbi:glutaminyl-tRNA synthetase [Anaeromyces robustus]|uniref:glutamine--tRNA ligase n=1 Tax=Anaeromyces robustus TaxID=1754192 RepID=A0A1Y1X710_9FUNG|nr:glutaminyl-tRNA synthetase [Anaeromyces robustus]|eukprot:ORX81559.1 glutaminyl-tRNA synthetase [Anaeromyces robustus]